MHKPKHQRNKKNYIIKINKIPRKKEYQYIKLMPLLKTTKPSEEVLEDLIHLTNKLKIKTKEKREIKALQHLYVVKLIENKLKREKLIQAINMKVGLLDDAINIGIKEGRQEGIKEGIDIGREEGIEKGREERNIEIAKLMKSNGAPIEEISTYTNLSKTEIKKLP